MSDELQLAAFCRNMGVQPPRDRLMARQLLKRADQIAAERGVEPLEALQELLSLLVSAKNGGNPL